MERGSMLYYPYYIALMFLGTYHWLASAPKVWVQLGWVNPDWPAKVYRSWVFKGLAVGILGLSVLVRVGGVSRVGFLF